MQSLAKKFMLVTSCAFSTIAFASEQNPFPAILCVDAERYWDGDYTIEITNANAEGKMFGQVYSQGHTGRALVANVNVEKNLNGTQLQFNGDNFKLELAMESLVPKTKYPAKLTFKNSEYAIEGEFVCVFMK